MRFVSWRKVCVCKSGTQKCKWNTERYSLEQFSTPFLQQQNEI